jgi:hypothetical protein
VGQSIKLKLLGRNDSTPQKNEYYFTRPNIPCLVDFSKCVIFVHPFEQEDGSFGADLVIKNYFPPTKEGKIIEDDKSID